MNRLPVRMGGSPRWPVVAATTGGVIVAVHSGWG